MDFLLKSTIPHIDCIADLAIKLETSLEFPHRDIAETKDGQKTEEEAAIEELKQDNVPVTTLINQVYVARKSQSAT